MRDNKLQAVISNFSNIKQLSGKLIHVKNSTPTGDDNIRVGDQVAEWDIY
jgi:hypothetical protein